MQVIPWGRRLHVCSQRWRRKPSLTWNETHWRVMGLEERSLRKTRIKVQGAEAKGNTLAKWGEMLSFSFSNKKGEEHHNHMAVKFYTEGVENSDLICSHWQPPCLGLSLNYQQASASRDTRTGRNAGNPQGHWNPVSMITEQDGLSLSTPGSKLSYFLISNQPPALFCRCPR